MWSTKKLKLTHWTTMVPSFTLLAQYAQLLPKSAWVYILHIGSNDITKTSCDNVNAEDLAQRISNIAKKKLDRLVLTTLQFHPF